MEFAINDRVETPHGIGVIKCKDICSVHVDKPEKGKVWTGRWGILHDVYPKDKPVGMYNDDILYYQPTELVNLSCDNEE